MSLIFYTSETSIGWAPHIALEESGLEYERVAIDFSREQQFSPEYLAINPKARVPALVVDDGIITETPAILTYIAQLAPDSRIGLPQDPFKQALIHSFNSYLCSTVHVAHAHKMRGTRWVQDKAAIAAMKAHVPKSLAVCFELIENEMLKGPWVHGETYSISDPYLYRIANWMEADGVDVNSYPKIKAHRESMSELPSVKAVEAYFQSLK